MNAKWLVVGVGLGFGMYAGSMACGSKNVGGSGGGGGGGVTSATVGSTVTSATTGGMTATTTTVATTTTTTGGGGGSSSTTASGMGGAGTSTTTGAGGAAECSKVGTLHPPPAGTKLTLYCPFSGVDGGAAQSCDPSMEHCCETPAGNGTPTMCVPTATACMSGSGYMDWECEDPGSDCPASSPVCCASGASIGLGTTNPPCGNFAHHMSSTTCVPAGSCAGIIMCTNNSECPAATPTCTPFDKAGAQVGGCM